MRQYFGAKVCKAISEETEARLLEFSEKYASVTFYISHIQPDDMIAEIYVDNKGNKDSITFHNDIAVTWDLYQDGRPYGFSVGFVRNGVLIGKPICTVQFNVTEIAISLDNFYRQKNVSIISSLGRKLESEKLKRTFANIS